MIVLLGLSLTRGTLSAQQSLPRNDSSATARGYKDLDDLLAHLPDLPRPVFDEARALWLGSFPLACLDRLQPPPRRAGRGAGGGAPADSTARMPGAPADSTGRGGTLGGRASASGADYFWVTSYRLIPDHKKTRAFWGCTDWHSAVSSIWVTARLIRQYPHFGLRELAREKLNDHLAKSNLAGELSFFRTAAGVFERPYGYAWLLKLHSELGAWPDSQARRWSANVAPLARWMADSLSAHISALKQPVRTATQTNTALFLDLALDYATPTVHPRLRTVIVSATRRLYFADRPCDPQAEAAANAVRGSDAGRGGRGAVPDSARTVRSDTADRAPATGLGGQGAPAGGNDILSPCLIEAALVGRVLAPAAFATWLDQFLPPLHSSRFAPLTEAPGAATTGNERARFTALAFQRAYAFERIARALPSTDPRIVVLRRLAAIHAGRGFELLRNETAGVHWLPAHALRYLTVRA